MNDLSAISLALFGGILPALVWLAFWLREDSKNPEPKRVIAQTFFFGMLAVIIVLPAQRMVDAAFPGMVLAAVVLLVILEEFFKFFAAWMGGLRSAEDNEPIDPMIYTITAALGFAALENALFILGPLADDSLTAGIITGNLRFVGASLLHVVSSAIVGAALSFSYYQSRLVRTAYVSCALVLAIFFHAAFNLFILHVENYGLAFAFGSVWAGVILILLAFEKAKTIAR